jgi:hypothetical protein
MEKVIIIGKGNGWEDAPLEGETWGVHSICLKRPVKMVFDMHRIGDPDYWEKLNNEQQEEQLDVMIKVNKDNIPLVTLKFIVDVPLSIRFPIEEMPEQYCTCSISYMIFYAILKGAKEIDIYGVLLAYEEEYVKQRPNVEYWIGYARGKGIKVTIHEPTFLFKSEKGLYGYDYDR